MARRLSTTSRRFAEEFSHLLAARGQAQQDVAEAVRAIIARVRAEGDAALCALTRKFDRCDVSPGTLRVTDREMAHALSLCGSELIASLKVAAARIRAYSERQFPADERFTDATGTMLGWKWTPLEAAGLYVPGGRAAYPSSVLMNAVPALAAGVGRLVMTVPAPGGHLSPAVLAAAHIAGVHEIYRAGGAQAVAALAYGTQTIAPVEKIVGPGNAYVAEAKRQVFGTVGIDMIAGPSEILIIADTDNDPAWLAADLLSQAEHDEAAQAILLTESAALANRVEKAVEDLLQTLPRADIARASWERHGAIILVRNLEEAAEVSNRLAPEHVELAVAAPSRLEPRIRHAGAIFLGKYTPEAIGDYVGGPSHVLPTSGTARFSSGLSVFDFLKRTSLIRCGKEACAQLGAYGGTLAQAEGLHAHALSLALRRGEGT